MLNEDIKVLLIKRIEFQDALDMPVLNADSGRLTTAHGNASNGMEQSQMHLR